MSVALWLCGITLQVVVALPAAREPKGDSKDVAQLIRRESSSLLSEAENPDDSGRLQISDWVQVTKGDGKPLLSLEIVKGGCFNTFHCVEAHEVAREDKASTWRLERDMNGNGPRSLSKLSIFEGDTTVLLHGLYGDTTHQGDTDTYLQMMPETCDETRCEVAAGRHTANAVWTIHKGNANPDSGTDNDVVHAYDVFDLAVEHDDAMWHLRAGQGDCPKASNPCVVKDEGSQGKTWKFKVVNDLQAIDELELSLNNIGRQNPLNEKGGSVVDMKELNETNAAFYGCIAMAMICVIVSCVYCDTMADVQEETAKIHGEHLDEVEAGIKQLVNSHGVKMVDATGFDIEQMSEVYNKLELDKLYLKEALVGYLISWEDMTPVFEKGSAGLKGSRYGPMGGGLSTVTTPISELGWEADGGGSWGETLGKAILGDKWENFLEGGSDVARRELLLLLRVKRRIIDEPENNVEGREHITIIPRAELNSVDQDIYFPCSDILCALILTPLKDSKYGQSLLPPDTMSDYLFGRNDSKGNGSKEEDSKKESSDARASQSPEQP